MMRAAMDKKKRDGHSYALLDTATNDTLQLREQYSFRLLGVQHFYDSFALVSQIGIREDALALFDRSGGGIIIRLAHHKQAALRKRVQNCQAEVVSVYVNQ